MVILDVNLQSIAYGDKVAFTSKGCEEVGTVTSIICRWKDVATITVVGKGARRTFRCTKPEDIHLGKFIFSQLTKTGGNMFLKEDS